MGTKISDIINVSILVEASRITRAGFGTPLIFAETNRQYERVVSYSSLDDMVSAGFQTTDVPYLMAADLLAQDKTPAVFKVGKVAPTANTLANITFDDAATAGTFTISISKDGGTAEESGTLAFDIAEAAAETAIELMSNVASVTITNLGTTNITEKKGFSIEFDGADAATDFRITAVDVSSLTGVSSASISHVTYGSAADSDFVTGYSACKAVDEDFYAVVLGDRAEANIDAMAAVIETERRLLFAETADADVITSATDDVASELKALGYDRTILLYNAISAEWKSAAWSGRCLPEDPGSITWAYQDLSSVSATSLTTAQKGYASGKNVNIVEYIDPFTAVFGAAPGRDGGNYGGIVISGEYIDVIRSVDLLQARLEENLLLLLMAQSKVPFTNDGLAAIEAEIRKTIELEGVQKGSIVQDSLEVSLPDLASYDTVKKGQRWLDGVTFTATLAGAIHKVTVNGTVSV